MGLFDLLGAKLMYMKELLHYEYSIQIIRKGVFTNVVTYFC